MFPDVDIVLIFQKSKLNWVRLSEEQGTLKYLQVETNGRETRNDRGSER
jgi:hypothetical protein